MFNHSTLEHNIKVSLFLCLSLKQNRNLSSRMFHCNFRLFGLTLNGMSVDISESFDNLDSLENFVKDNFGVNIGEYYVLYNGKKIDNHLFHHNSNSDLKVLQIVPRTFGGKGGFGSMLRAIGAQIEKTTNREACRDLSGRRLRDINEEQRLKNWIAHQAEREKEVLENRKKKLERMCQEPKHEFKDDKYDESRSTMPEELSIAIDEGIKAVSKRDTSQAGVKRKPNDESEPSLSTKVPSKKKKKNLWIDVTESESSEEEGNDMKKEGSVVC